MKKKWIALLMAGVMALTMAGCGDSKEPVDNGGDGGSGTETVSTLESAPEMSTVLLYDNYQEENSATPIVVNGYYNEFFVGHQIAEEDTADSIEADSRYEKLGETVQNLNTAINSQYEAAMTKIQGTLMNQRKLGLSGSYSAVVSFQGTVIRADSLLTSLELTQISYNGALGTQKLEYVGYTFDSQTGEQLMLSDFLTDEGKEKFSELFLNLLKDQYAAISEEEWTEEEETIVKALLEQTPAEYDKESEVYSFEGSQSGLAFVVEKNHIMMLIAPGTFADESYGPMAVAIPYEGNESLMQSKYFNTEGDYVERLSYNVVDATSLRSYSLSTGKGEFYITFNASTSDGDNLLRITAGDNAMDVNMEDMAALTPYHFSIGDKEYLYLSIFDSDGTESVCVVDITGGTLTNLGKCDGVFGFNTPTDPNAFWMYAAGDSSYKTYTAGTSGPEVVETNNN